MSVQLKTRHVAAPRVRVLELDGVIDEKFIPSSSELVVAERMPTVIDLGGVRRITSFGVRRWLDWVAQLSGTEYYFTRCRPAIVWQFNIVARFGGTGRVVSLFVPYSCAAGCGHDSEFLLDLRNEHDVVVSGQPPEQRCAACGGLAEFDEDSHSYFAYLRNAPPLQLPAAVAAFLDDSIKSASIPLKIRKEVTAAVTAVWLSGSINENAKFKRVADGLDGTVLIVAQGVRGVTEAGLGKLIQVLTAETTDAFISRAPIELARAMLRQPESLRLPIVSLWVGLQCDSCSEIHMREFDRQRWMAFRSGVFPGCLRCGGSLSPLTEDAADPIAVNQVETMSPEVETYLEQHGDVPSDAQPELTTPPPPMTQTQPGPLSQVKLDGYDVISRLGVGGMAEVMLARQVGPQGFNKLVALKRILPSLASDPVFIDMFVREAQIAAAISHANVVQIYDLRQTDSNYFIVMEYVPGWNLDQVIRAATLAVRHMPVEFACRIVSEICGGLHAAHSATAEDGRPLIVVHRDVSPHNVLVSKVGAIKLTDFGIAKATNVTAVTRTDGLKGKFLYMAPERFEGTDSDIRSDIFSAGLVLFLCLTHTHPFQGPTEYSTWENAVRSVVPPPSAYRPDVPPELDAILARSVARDRAERYQTAQELQLALESFLTSWGRSATSTHVAGWLNELFLYVGVSPTAPGFVRAK